MYSSLDLSRGQLEEKGEEPEKTTDSPLNVDSLSWTPDFTEMYVKFNGKIQLLMIDDFKLSRLVMYGH